MNRRITILDLLMLVIALLCLYVGPVKAANDAQTNYTSKGFAKDRFVSAEETACLFSIRKANQIYSFTIPATKIPMAAFIRNTHATANLYYDVTRAYCFNTTGTGSTTAGSTTFNLGGTVTGLRAGDLIVFTTNNADEKPYVISSVTSTSVVELADAPTLTTASQGWRITSRRLGPGEYETLDVGAGPVAFQGDANATTFEFGLSYQRKS